MRIKIFRITTLILFISFLIFALLHTYWTLTEFNFPLSFFVYLAFILFLFFFYLTFHIKSGLYLWAGVLIYVVGSLLSVFGLFSFAEPPFRFSFILFVAGMLQALIEYIQNK